MCILLLGLLLCWRHDCFVGCFELRVVVRIGRQHKRKDWVVGAEINWMMSRREQEKVEKT
jgi:hypothetical protein